MLIYLAMIDSPDGKSKFETIYHKYRDVMFYAAYKILLDACDAEDIVHESFLKIIDILDTIKDTDIPQTRALVVIICEHKAIDLYRKKQREKVIPFEEEYIGGRHQAEVERSKDRPSLMRSKRCRSSTEKRCFSNIPTATPWMKLQKFCPFQRKM